MQCKSCLVLLAFIAAGCVHRATPIQECSSRPDAAGVAVETKMATTLKLKELNPKFKKHTEIGGVLERDVFRTPDPEAFVYFVVDQHFPDKCGLFVSAYVVLEEFGNLQQKWQTEAVTKGYSKADSVMIAVDPFSWNSSVLPNNNDVMNEYFTSAKPGIATFAIRTNECPTRPDPAASGSKLVRTIENYSKIGELDKQVRQVKRNSMLKNVLERDVLQRPDMEVGVYSLEEHYDKVDCGSFLTLYVTLVKLANLKKELQAEAMSNGYSKTDSVMITVDPWLWNFKVLPNDQDVMRKYFLSLTLGKPRYGKWERFPATK